MYLKKDSEIFLSIPTFYLKSFSSFLEVIISLTMNFGIHKYISEIQIKNVFKKRF